MIGSVSLQLFRPRSIMASVAILAAVTVNAGQWAAPRVVNVMEYTGNIRGVTTPTAHAAVIHEEMGYFIVGHRADENGRQLSVFVLDDEGRPAAEPVRMPLPAAAGTEHLSVYPLSLTLHPQLPLIYVFCDALPPEENAEETLALAYRLHVYLMRPGGGGLTLLRSTGAGAPFGWQQSIGLSELDQNGRNLFLPHARDNGGHAVAYVPLDRRGMPRADADDLMEVVTESVGVLGRGFNPGLGYVAGSSDAVVFAGPHGPVTWDLLNRRARFVRFTVNEAPVTVLIGGRTDDASFYIAGRNSGFLAHMFQARGYVTLLPQIVAIDERLNASFQGPPVVMSGADQVAVAGEDGVYVFDLEDNGRISDTAGFARLKSGERRILAWSERFQTLYTVNP